MAIPCASSSLSLYTHTVSNDLKHLAEKSAGLPTEEGIGNVIEA